MSRIRKFPGPTGQINTANGYTIKQDGSGFIGIYNTIGTEIGYIADDGSGNLEFSAGQATNSLYLAVHGIKEFWVDGTSGKVTIHTLISSYQNILTAGLGVPAIYLATFQKNETGVADNNVGTYIPPAVAGSYRASMSLDVSASAAGVCGWTISYKDSNGNAQTPTNIIMFASGVLAGGLTLMVAAGGHYFGYMDFDIDNSATNIVFKFTYTSGTLAAKMTVRLEQLG